MGSFFEQRYTIKILKNSYTFLIERKSNFTEKTSDDILVM